MQDNHFPENDIPFPEVNAERMTPEQHEVALNNFCAYINACNAYNEDLEEEEKKRDHHYWDEEIKQVMAARHTEGGGYRANYYSSEFNY